MPVKPKIYDDSIFEDTATKKPEKVYDDSAFTGEPVKKKEAGGEKPKPYSPSAFQFRSPWDAIPETQTPLPDEEVYSLVQERKKLKEQQREYELGGPPISEKTFQEDKKRLEENTNKLKSAGLDPDEVEGIYADMPLLPSFGVTEAVLLKRDNPEFFERRKAAIKYRSELYNAVKEEFGETAAKTYINDLAEEQKSHDYGEVRDGTRHLVSEIYARFDDGDKQKKLINDVIKDRMYTYGLNLPGTEEAIANDPRLGTFTHDQVLALQFLEDTDPQTAQSFNRLLSLTPEEIQKASKNNTSFKLGLQMKQKELEDIGLNIQQRAVEEKMKTLLTKKEKGEMTEEEAAEGNRLYAVRKDILEKRDAQNANYPLAVAADADRLMQDFLGARHGTFSKTLLRIGENADDLINFAVNAAAFQGAKDGRIDDLERFGSKQLGQLSQYDTKEEELFGRAFVPVASGPLKEKLDAIKNDKTLTREQQEDKARAAIFEDNYNNLSYVANDKAGKFNFTGKAILNSVSNVASEIVPQIFASYVTAGGANATKLQQLSSLFGNTFAMAYNDYYTDAINRNIAKPNDYAILHTTIEAATELFGNNIEMAKRAFAGTTAGKLLGEATEEQINAIAKAGKGKFRNFGEALVKTGKIAEKNARIEGFEEFSGAIAGNAVDKLAFNQDVALADGSLKDFVTTYVGMIPLGVLGLPFQYKNVNMLQKRSLYEAAGNPAKFFEKLDQQVEDGTMNPNDAFQVKQRITDGYESLKEMNVVKSDGTIMTDNEKADYLFNKVVQKDIEKHKAEAPVDQQDELDKVNDEISKQNDVLSSPAQSQKVVEELHTKRDAELKEIDDKLAGLDTKSENYGATKKELEKKREDVIEGYNQELRAAKESNPKTQPTQGEPQIVDTEAAATKTQPVDIPSLQQVVTDNIEQVQGYSKDALQQALPEQLPNYFKNIAEQARDPKTEQTTLETFGEAIVNTAKEMFPVEDTKQPTISYSPRENVSVSEETLKNTKVHQIRIGIKGVGAIALAKEPKGNNYYVDYVETDKAMRGKGMAKELYYEAIKLLNSRGQILEPGGYSSPNVVSVWKRLEKEGLAVIDSIVTGGEEPGMFVIKGRTIGKTPVEATKDKSLSEKGKDLADKIRSLKTKRRDSNFDAFDRQTGAEVPKGTYNLSDFLKKYEVTGNETAKKLLDHLSKHSYFNNVKLYVTDRMEGGVKGEAIVTAGIMKVSPNVDAETLAHEMMHFLTSKIFTNPYETLSSSEKQLRNGVNKIIKEFDPDSSYLDKALGKLGYKRSEYAQEIIAEAFTGSWFAKELAGKQVKLIRTKRIDKNLIQKIIDKIVSFFGGQISDTVKSEEKANVVEALKLVFANHGSISAQRLQELNKPTGKYESLKSRTSIFGVSPDIYDGSLETIATAIEHGAPLADAINQGIQYIRDNGGNQLDEEGFKKHIEDQVEGRKPKVKVQIGEETEQKEEKPKSEPPKPPKPPESTTEEPGEENVGDYKMTTSGEVNKFLSGATWSDVFGEDPTGDQQYETQRLSDMLQDGRNMIAIAQKKWGNDVMMYARPLFQFIQGMTDAETTNKKAVLLATFLGELQEAKLRSPERFDAIQQIEKAVFAHYQQFMNQRGKEIVAARLLRLYRDKYIGDIFADRILDETQAKAKKAIQDAEQKKDIDEKTASEETATVTKEEKTNEDKAAKKKTESDKKKQSKKKKMSTDEAKQKADQKIKDIEDRMGKEGKSGLINKIKDAIKKLNCK